MKRFSVSKDDLRKVETTSPATWFVDRPGCTFLPQEATINETHFSKYFKDMSSAHIVSLFTETTTGKTVRECLENENSLNSNEEVNSVERNLDRNKYLSEMQKESLLVFMDAYSNIARGHDSERKGLENAWKGRVEEVVSRMVENPEKNNPSSNPAFYEKIVSLCMIGHEIDVNGALNSIDTSLENINESAMVLELLSGSVSKSTLLDKLSTIYQEITDKELLDVMKCRCKNERERQILEKIFITQEDNLVPSWEETVENLKKIGESGERVITHEVNMDSSA